MSRTTERSCTAFSTLASVALLCFALISPAALWAGGKAYGRPIDKARGQTVRIDALYADSSKYVGKNVIVEGKASQVCQASGCWLMLTDGGGNQLYVQFYDFTVRMGTGTRLRVQGEVRTQNKVPYLVGEGLEVVR